MMNELARLHVRDLSGVFAARRLGRELAALLGLDRQDQVRVATALSEISRSVITDSMIVPSVTCMPWKPVSMKNVEP